ncbi:hypothetical protein BUALT_Bualt15G0035100 [Buddleja alternifolia]|uniref:Alpha/beta hydrolase fold-3 domain-containing protein n=1 Tax=Buddleja alternifolia TaxID=168488 RepID=A0AAV6WIV2_9LAMI|nr:hypothetical protein BUALT_Bualt15G0035100 [Buddleja alternifolia]
MAANSNKILHDFPAPFMFRHFKDGQIERYAGTDVVPVSLDPKIVVQSKDDDISPENNISARLYLPADSTQAEKLPIIVYFHGSGFVMESTFSPLFHKHLKHFKDGQIERYAGTDVVPVSLDPKIVVQSKDDDISPENNVSARLYLSAEATQAKKLPIIVYFHGSGFVMESTFSPLFDKHLNAGGNIAHYMAIRVGSENPDGINLCGVFLNRPFFGGAEVDQIKKEAPDSVLSKSFVDRLWLYVCPTIKGAMKHGYIRRAATDPRQTGIQLEKPAKPATRELVKAWVCF